MDLHIEKACAGLRGIAKYNGAKPDFFLYIGPSNVGAIIPESISGIAVIATPAHFGGIDFGMACDLLYVPCYREMKAGHCFKAYKDAYEDYI